MILVIIFSIVKVLYAINHWSQFEHEINIFIFLLVDVDKLAEPIGGSCQIW